MSIETLVHFLVATAVVVIIPGPNTILILTDSLRFGFKKSLGTVAGVSAGMIPLFALSLAGVSSLLIRFPRIFYTLKLIGAAYLFYLGARQMLDAFKTKSDSALAGHQKDNCFVKGFIISSSNPKGLLFAGAFFPQFLDASAPLMHQALLLCIGCLLVSSLIGALYALFASTAHHYFESPVFQKRTALLSGLILMFFSAGLGISNVSDWV